MNIQRTLGVDTLSVNNISASGTVDFEGATLTAATPASGDSSKNVATTAFVSNAISSAVGGISGISLETVTTLPATGTTGVIYLLSNGGTSPNQYDEYIWTGGAFEKIGTTAVDLSEYWAKNDLKSITNTQIDSMCV